MTRALGVLCAVLYLAVARYAVADDPPQVAAGSGFSSATVEIRPGQDGVGKDRLSAIVRLTDADLVAGHNKTVDVNVQNATLRDAVKAILGPAKIEYKVDDDVPAATRVTLVAKQVRLRTVLDLLAQAAGVGWQQELDQAKFRIRFGKAAREWDIAASVFKPIVPGEMPKVLSFAADPNAKGLLWRRFAGTETRSTISCPHCKSQITAVRERKETKCPKCGLVYEDGWKVCPRDGTKRPESGSDWKYCPICGKPFARD